MAGTADPRFQTYVAAFVPLQKLLNNNAISESSYKAICAILEQELDNRPAQSQQEVINTIQMRAQAQTPPTPPPEVQGYGAAAPQTVSRDLNSGPDTTSRDLNSGSDTMSRGCVLMISLSSSCSVMARGQSASSTCTCLHAQPPCVPSFLQLFDCHMQMGPPSPKSGLRWTRILPSARLPAGLPAAGISAGLPPARLSAAGRFPAGLSGTYTTLSLSLTTAFVGAMFD